MPQQGGTREGICLPPQKVFLKKYEQAAPPDDSLNDRRGKFSEHVKYLSVPLSVSLNVDNDICVKPLIVQQTSSKTPSVSGQLQLKILCFVARQRVC